MGRLNQFNSKFLIWVLVMAGAGNAEELLVNAIINHRRCDEIIPIKIEENKVILLTSDLEKCRVIGIGESQLEIDNKHPSYHYDLDLSRLELTLSIPENFISLAQIDARQDRIATGVKTYAFGLNYDATFTHIQHLDQGIVLPEALIFTPYGFIKSSGLFQSHPSHQVSKSIRLESTFLKEFPDYLASLRIGDGVTRSSSWTSASRIGGIQWRSNFNTQENFIYYPLPSISGSSAVPTSLDVFINNSQIYSGRADAGPYQVNNLPVVNGSGNLILESVDLLGRKVQIEVPYYATPDLLKEGVQDYSYEIGKLRKNYGFESNDYEHFVGAMTHRYGVNNTLTAGIHSEIAKQTKLIGGDVTKLINNWAVVSLSAAISKTYHKNGNLFQLSLNRQATPFGFGVVITRKNPVFRDLSELTYTADPPRLTIQAYGSYSHEVFGSFSLSYTERNRYSGKKDRLITANYQKSYSSGYNFFITAFKSLTDNKNYTILTGVSKAFDNNLIIDGSVNHGTDNNRQSISFNKNFSGNYGTLYRGRLNHEDNGLSGEANISKLTPYGDASLLATHYDSGNLYQGGLSGALIYATGSAAITQKVNSSLGIVKAGDIPEIMVKNNNLDIGKTDKNGTLIVPNLSTYSRADLKLQDEDIPLDISYDKSRSQFYADSTSAYLIDFDLKKTLNRSLRVVRSSDGSVLDAGTIIHWEDGTQNVVGYNGEIYLTDTQ